MQTIYLIRHALPDIPEGTRMCLGRTDVPLGTLGTLQSLLLGEYMKTIPLAAVYCSDLSRAVQTAQYLCPEPVIVPGLEEMDAGDWDGLTFAQIQTHWPEIYEKRGTDPNYPIPGAEDVEDGQHRFLSAVKEILTRQEGDFAIVAHSTVIQSFISFVLGTDVRKCRRYRHDYTGITTVHYENGTFSLSRMNEIPALPLSLELCEKLLTAADAPVAHCREVAEKAAAVTRELAAAGVDMDAEAVYCGALLHDIARKEQNHPAVGSHWLKTLGWPDIANIVQFHHDPENTDITEKNIIFLADKVPLEDRFTASLQKCRTPEARNAHHRRYQAALALKEKINTLCGKEVIQ